MIIDKSQGSVAAHLRYGGLLSYHFTKYLLRNLVMKKFFLIGEHLAKLQAERLIVLCALFALQCPAQR